MTITPDTLGEVRIDLLAGSARDGAGNESQAASLSVEAVVQETEVEVTVDSGTTDPTTISASVELRNPGATDISFRTVSDVDWLLVTPESGSCPPLARSSSPSR